MASHIGKANVSDLNGNLIITVDLEALSTITDLQHAISQDAGIPVPEQRLLLGEHDLCGTDLIADMLASPDKKNITLVRVGVAVIVRLGVLCKAFHMGRISNTHWQFDDKSRFRIEAIPSTSSLEDLVLSIAAEMAKTSDEELKNALSSSGWNVDGAYIEPDVQEFRDAVAAANINYLAKRMRLLTSTETETLRGGGENRWSEFGLVSLSQLDKCTVGTLPVSEDVPLPDEGTRAVKMYLTCAAPDEVPEFSEGPSCTIS